MSEWNPLMSGLVGAVVGGILLALAQRKAAVVQGLAVARYGLLLRGISILMLVVAMAITFVATKVKPDEVWLMIAFAIGFWLFAVAIVLESFVVRIAWDAEHIHTRSPWRKARKIPWADVMSLDYSAAMQWHRIFTRTNGVIRVTDMLGGKESLFAAVRSKGESMKPSAATPRLGISYKSQAHFEVRDQRHYHYYLVFSADSTVKVVESPTDDDSFANDTGIMSGTYVVRDGLLEIDFGWNGRMVATWFTDERMEFEVDEPTGSAIFSKRELFIRIDQWSTVDDWQK